MKIVVLDIGGTSIKAGEWEDGELFNLKEYDTAAKNGGQYVMDKAVDIIKGYKGFERIGISTAGQVNSKLGIIRYANPNIPNYTGTRVKEIMLKEFGVPTAVENDVNAAAIGEARFGAGREFDDFLCLTYGTGVGGAIIIDKKIYSGSKFSAGEVGSLVVHADKKVEGDLLSGCYERYASTTALVRNMMNYDSSLSNGKRIFDAIENEKVCAIIDAWITEVVYGLTSLIHIFNPECIVLGGGILNEKYVIDRINKIIYTNIMESFSNVVIKQTQLGNRAGLYGAAYLAQDLSNS